MKILTKILFVILFFIFSLLNNNTIFDDCIQSCCFSIKKQEHHLAIETNENEGMIILPSNSDGNNTVFSVGNSHLPQGFDKFFFAKNRYIAKNQYTIVYSYKTEVFPNAP